MGYCRKPVEPGRKRCRWHAGLSTGPVTIEGKARVVAAMNAGRAKWRAAGGHPRPWHRRPPDVVARARAEKLRLQAKRRRAWLDRKAKREAKAEHKRRQERINAGLPLWTPEELEKL
jgi:hypothetical protein